MEVQDDVSNAFTLKQLPAFKMFFMKKSMNRRYISIKSFFSYKDTRITGFVTKSSNNTEKIILKSN